MWLSSATLAGFASFWDLPACDGVSPLVSTRVGPLGFPDSKRITPETRQDWDMRHQLKLTLILICLALCTTFACADLFVKNKPFKGQVVGAGSAMMVEAEAFLKALGVEYQVGEDGLVIGEVTVKMDGTMVSLAELAEAVGLKVIQNKDLGTTDVYQSGEKQSGSSHQKMATTSYAPPGTGEWITSWDEAARTSKATNRPIMMNFTGSDWCGWCIRLKEEVFNTPEFKTWASQKVVLLELDFPRGKTLPDALKAQNEKLSAKFRVSGYPSIIFSDADGNQIGQRYGYKEGGPAAWTAGAEQIMGSGR